MKSHSSLATDRDDGCWQMFSRDEKTLVVVLPLGRRTLAEQLAAGFTTLVSQTVGRLSKNMEQNAESWVNRAV